VRLTARQAPVFGEKFNGLPLRAWSTFVGRTLANSNKKSQNPFDLERHTPVPPLGDWPVSRLGVLVPLGPMRIKHHALSELDMRR
jgi:hypothetical protein